MGGGEEEGKRGGRGDEKQKYERAEYLHKKEGGKEVKIKRGEKKNTTKNKCIVIQGATYA